MRDEFGYDPAHEDMLYDIMSELGVTFTLTKPINNFDLNEAVLFLFKYGIAIEKDPHFFGFFMGSYRLFNDVYQKFGTLDYVLEKLAGTEEEAVCRGLIELLRRRVDGTRDGSVKVHECGPKVYRTMQRMMPFRKGYPDKFDDDFKEIFGVQMFYLDAQPSRKYYLRAYLAQQRPEIWG